MKRIQTVTYFGYSGFTKTDALYRETYDVAKLIAAEGVSIVNGGFGGVMEAVSHGARDAGAHVIGVTFYPKEATHFEKTTNANPWIDEEIITDNYLTRTLKLIELGDIYIIFNGGTGTISEFAMVWGLARIYYGKHKPLILYGSFWKNIIDTFNKNMFLRPEELEVFTIVNNADEAVDALKKYDNEIYIRHLNGNVNIVTPEDASNIE